MVLYTSFFSIYELMYGNNLPLQKNFLFTFFFVFAVPGGALLCSPPEYEFFPHRVFILLILFLLCIYIFFLSSTILLIYVYIH